jgi:hypothetical protein
MRCAMGALTLIHVDNIQIARNQFAIRGGACTSLVHAARSPIEISAQKHLHTALVQSNIIAIIQRDSARGKSTSAAKPLRR